MNKSDVIGLIAILIMVIGAGMLCYYYVIYEIHQCTADPLRYGFDREVPNNLNYSYVKIYLYNQEGDLAPIKSIEFRTKK